MKSIHGESHMNTYQGGRNQPKKKLLGHVCVILSSEILKVVCITTKLSKETVNVQTASIPASYR